MTKMLQQALNISANCGANDLIVSVEAKFKDGDILVRKCDIGHPNRYVKVVGIVFNKEPFREDVIYLLGEDLCNCKHGLQGVIEDAFVKVG